MNTIPRRKLDELAFLYERHPEQCDIYVEGPFDRAMLTWFLRENGLESACVYTIDSIEIPEGEVIAAGRKANNRERTVYLSDFLARHGVKKATCLIDADFGYLRQEKITTSVLLLTDYSCMEMYLFTEQSISKFITLCCHRTDWPVDTIMESLSSVLQELFAYRFANEELSWGMDWLNGSTCMEINGWQIVFDSKEFVARFLNKNKRGRTKRDFLTAVAKLRKTFMSDPRYQMHGHDFIESLAWYLRAKNIRGQKATPESVLLCLTMSVNSQNLNQERMFQRLVGRLSGS
jgi:hypothetical protein